MSPPHKARHKRQISQWGDGYIIPIPLLKIKGAIILNTLFDTAIDIKAANVHTEELIDLLDIIIDDLEENGELAARRAMVVSSLCVLSRSLRALSGELSECAGRVEREGTK